MNSYRNEDELKIMAIIASIAYTTLKSKPKKRRFSHLRSHNISYWKLIARFSNLQSVKLW